MTVFPKCDTLYALRVEPKMAPQWHQEGAKIAPHRVDIIEVETRRAEMSVWEVTAWEVPGIPGGAR